ncbi:tyrosine-type recombinase/integrase [Fodinibius sp. AD559]|uniref:tyrosine-type recombinase/integrase n=1 Tax=Fodinibius sp. AD559 TaxID=3424179 RepID=UPI004046A966
MDYAVYPFKRKNKYRLYVRFEDENGERKHLSTGITYPLKASKKKRKKAQQEAKQKAADLLVDYFKEQRILEEEESKAMELSDYLGEYYWPHVGATCADTTLVSYQGALNHFMRIIGDDPLDEYDRKMISKYKIHRLDQENIAKTTINIEIRSIKAAFSWAYKNDFLQSHPYKGQEFLFKTKSKKREFKRYEIKKLLEHTEGTHIGLVIKLAYFTGMRIGEMTKVTWNMVNLDDRYIDLSAGITKTFQRRAIPLGNKAYYVAKMFGNILDQKMKKSPEKYKNVTREECYLLQKQRGHGQYKTRSIQDKFRRCMNEAGLPKELTFHCLRHSFATHVLENSDADLFGVSKLLGHTTPNVTAEFYAHTDALNYRQIADMI